MSASDAAPLPRLGEVFFDVRGESRSMRLSWYADTGVAVFSIWQGGTCTGTFRLPIADLPRMVDSLQRGPHGRDGLITGEQPASREPRLPGPPGPPGPPGSPRPEALDGDIRTGQTTGALYLPPVESDLTGYQAEPPLPDYSGEYAAGPPAPGFPGEYPAGPPAPGFAAEPPPAAEAPGQRRPRRRGREPHELPAGYPGEPLAPDLPGEPLAPDLPGEPSHAYSGGPAGHGSGEYDARPVQGYPGEAPHDYLGGPDAAGYHAEPAGPVGGYAAEETLSAGYHGDYQEGSPGAEPGGPLDDLLAAGPAGGYRHESRGRYPAGRAARTGPGRRGYPSGGATGPASGDYGEPMPGGYPGEEDYQHYHEELPAAEYGSPVRPYMNDTRDTDEPFADDPPPRHEPRGRRRAEPAPGSFPYGPPPADDEPQRRGPHPGQH
jgi:hypothetical protein